VFRIVHTFTLVGARPERVRVEVTLRRGTPGIRTSGLSPTAARHAVERIRAVAAGLSLRIPGLRITVNLAPADIPKTGASFDLPILIGILAASGSIPGDRLRKTALVGELGLDGSLRPVRGILPMALRARGEADLSTLILPEANLSELAGVPGRDSLGAGSVADVLSFLARRAELQRPGPAPACHPVRVPELADVRGQATAKRALEIAAAGGHHLLLSGEPGAGKSMLATRLPGILPELDPEESLEVTSLHSIAGCLGAGSPLVRLRPFRAPHHSVTVRGMIGGGTVPRPGEVSLAHHGVLFLDELTEFRSPVLESLRAPLEQGVVHISRSGSTTTYPARIQLVAAMNPCPCGFRGSPADRCTCEDWQVRRYVSRLSGPLLDRFDMRVEVPAVRWQELRAEPAEHEFTVHRRARVELARSAAAARSSLRRAPPADPRRPEAAPVRRNADLSPPEVRLFCEPDAAGERLLKRFVPALGLSARGCDRILKVARTIADLEASETVRAEHIAEAVHFRHGWRPPRGGTSAFAGSSSGGPC